jgi:rhodanese-related sulfurtransferase
MSPPALVTIALQQSLTLLVMRRSSTPTTAIQPSQIARVLEESRRNLDRVEPAGLAAEMAAGALVVDTRSVAHREAEGALPGAIVIERTVLEWRVDPTSPDRVPEADDPERRVIVVCSDGYSSSLAAETLQRLGLPRATDLVGGYRAWSAWVHR